MGCRSRPSHVLRATPTINPLVSLHDPASTKSPTSLRQAQPSHQQAWRHPRIWTPPACTSQRLTSVLERTKTTQIQRIFKSCQANNHCQDDETRSHRTLLRPAPAPIRHQDEGLGLLEARLFQVTSGGNIRGGSI